MSSLKTLTYLIPGWGFDARLFYDAGFNDDHYIGLNYYEESQFSLNHLSKVLARDIADASHVIGWSFGGLIAIKLACLFPHKVKKLTLIAVSPKIIEDHLWQGMSTEFAMRFIEQAGQNFQQQKSHFINLVNYPNIRAAFKKILLKNHITDRDEGLIKMLHVLLFSDLREEYRALNIKILHLMGSKDVIIKSNAQQLLSLNRHTHIISLMDSGHAGFLTHASLYHSHINNFLYEK